MSDAIAALKQRIADYNEAKDNLTSMINSLEIAVKVIENDAPIPSLTSLKGSARRNPPPTTKRGAPVHKAKAEKPAKAIPRKGGRPYTSDDVVDTAVELIRRSGPQPVMAITAAVYSKFAKAKMSVSTALIQNAKKKKGARVEKTTDGLWKIVSPEKQGKVAHSPEEAEKLLAQARANKFNEATDQIRA